MIRIDLKPLSVNEAWQGKRFKTKAYKKYELLLSVLLPKIKMPEPPYEMYYEFGMGNILSDIDNPVKPLQDILQKKYGFNDREILKATIRKIKVPKGTDYIKFEIKTLTA